MYLSSKKDCLNNNLILLSVASSYIFTLNFNQEIIFYLELFPNLAHLSIKNEEYKSELEIFRLGNFIENSKLLSYLQLSFFDLDEVKMKYFCGYLSQNNSITNLILNNDKIGKYGAIELSNFIINSKILNTINLSDNLIGDEGTNVLIKAILQNCSIENINLSNNLISDKVGKELCKSIFHRKNFLLSLNLSKNCLGKLVYLISSVNLLSN